MQTGMKRVCCSAAFAGVLTAVLAGAVQAQGTDPVIGTWTLNVAKSTYSPGPAPRSTTLRYEAAGQGIRISVNSVNADGTAAKWGFTANYDGKDVSITGNNPNADSAALKRLDATTSETTYKKGGTVTTTNTRVVSANRRTMTITTKGTDSQGQTVNNVAVYEKRTGS